MPDEVITEDSATGEATDVASQETGNEEAQSATENEGESEGEASTADEGRELELYDFGEFQASQDDLRSWKDAYEKKRDTDAAWTQKTQALSAEKKTFEAEREKVNQKLEMLTALESEIDSLLMGDLAKVDLDKVLAEEGTDEFLKYQREIDKRKGAKAVITQKIKKAREADLATAQKTLSDMLGWSDQDKQKTDVESINAYVSEVQMPLKEFNEVNSPHIMQALLEAKQYRDLVKKREETSKKVIQAPKITKPAATQAKKTLSLAERMYRKTMRK